MEKFEITKQMVEKLKSTWIESEKWTFEDAIDALVAVGEATFEVKMTREFESGPERKAYLGWRSGDLASILFSDWTEVGEEYGPVQNFFSILGLWPGERLMESGIERFRIIHLSGSGSGDFIDPDRSRKSGTGNYSLRSKREYLVEYIDQGKEKSFTWKYE